MKELPSGVRRRNGGYQVSYTAGGVRRRAQCATLAEAAEERERMRAEAAAQVRAQADALAAAGLPVPTVLRLRRAEPVAEGQRREPVPGSVGAILARYCERVGASGRPDSLRNARRACAVLDVHLGDRVAAALTGKDVDRFTTARRAKIGPASVALELRYLKAALRLAVAEKVLPAMPCEVKIKREKLRPVTLAPADLLRALREAPDYLRPLLTFTAATGWRSGEVRAICWDMVDLDAGVATIRANPLAAFPGPKGCAERVVNLGPDALAVLRAQAARVSPEPDAPCFPARRGGYWSTSRLANAVSAHLAALGLARPRLKPLHGFRALFINTALRQGAHLGDVAAAVGHSDARTTLGYLTNDARAERDVAARVGAALGLGELAESA